jgi:hypothetical protein
MKAERLAGLVIRKPKRKVPGQFCTGGMMMAAGVHEKKVTRAGSP